jgi:hypothetical protein
MRSGRERVMDSRGQAGYNDRMGAAAFCARCRLLQPAGSRYCRACGVRAVRRLRAAHTRTRARFRPGNPVPLVLLGTLGAAVVIAVVVDPANALSLEGAITVGCIGTAAAALIAANLVRRLTPLAALPGAAVTPSAEARRLTGTLQLRGVPVRDFDGRPCAVALLRITVAGGVLLRATRAAEAAVDTGAATIRVTGELWTAADRWQPVGDSDAALAALALPDDLAGDAVFEQLVLGDGDRVELHAAVRDELGAAEYRDAVAPVARGQAGAPVLVAPVA